MTEKAKPFDDDPHADHSVDPDEQRDQESSLPTEKELEEEAETSS